MWNGHLCPSLSERRNKKKQTSLLGVTIHTHQLKKNKGPKKEKMSRTLMNNCEKVKFLLWEVSENLSLMAWD
ncbi:hypothetical protein A9498_30025 (plasmid) [Bacillus thuringiensis serovar coreanensis]|nr:hypothetical protein A9498_30025 [Bacillus thuringiensis serovar coreanensis]